MRQNYRDVDRYQVALISPLQASDIIRFKRIKDAIPFQHPLGISSNVLLMSTMASEASKFLIPANPRAILVICSGGGMSFSGSPYPAVSSREGVLPKRAPMGDGRDTTSSSIFTEYNRILAIRSGH